jgi:toxin ParE1/3/4
MVYVRPRAEKDIAQACQWYEKEQAGLSDRLIGEVNRAIRILEQDADRFPLYYRQFRRILLTRFPYKIFY